MKRISQKKVGFTEISIVKTHILFKKVIFSTRGIRTVKQNEILNSIFQYTFYV